MRQDIAIAMKSEDMEKNILKCTNSRRVSEEDNEDFLLQNNSVHHQTEKDNEYVNNPNIGIYGGVWIG